jgi:predicted SPOUT superfamily RNA methylase MTH1
MSGEVEISVAIPDSCLQGEQTLRDKTLKIGQIARASSIFRVKKIYLYQDREAKVKNSDRRLIILILRYLDTPQYLRRELFPRQRELRYAGLLPPVRAPHHKEWLDMKAVKNGEIRVGVVVRIKNKLFVNVGIDEPVRLEGLAHAGAKLNVRLKSTYPNISAVKVDRHDINFHYWGFLVHGASSLKALLDRFADGVIVITSRGGNSLSNVKPQLIHELRKKRKILLVFGSPKKGVPQILSDEGYDSNAYQFVVNMFPNQGTQSVRLEEAFLGTLAIINFVLNS